MANQGSEQVAEPLMGRVAPGLAGLYGRLRFTVAGKPVATLVVEGIYVALVPDTHGPADATALMRRRRDDVEAVARPAESVHRVDARAGAPCRRSWFRHARRSGPAGRIAVRG